LVCPIVECLSERAIDQRALSFLHVDLFNFEEIVDVEDYILLEGFIIADDESEVELSLLGVFGEENLEDERTAILFCLLYGVCLLCEAFYEGGEDDKVVQDLVQVLDFLLAELHHDVEGLRSLRDLFVLVENSLPEVGEGQSEIRQLLRISGSFGQLVDKFEVEAALKGPLQCL
jgi:hypothetical protein